jgi:predicted phosphodiesterase
LSTAVGLALLALGGALFVEPAHPGRVPRSAGGQPLEIPTNGEPWSVLVIADAQNGFHHVAEVFEASAPDRPRAVLALGDLARRPDPGHQSLFVRELQRHPPPAPFFAIPGNHDISPSLGHAEFVHRYGATHFDLTLGNTRLLGADNSSIAVAPKDLERLRRGMADAAARGQRIVLAVHRPPVSLADCGPTNPELAALIREFHVAVVLSGHCHQPVELRRDGTLYVVAPPSGDTPALATKPPIGFLVLRGSDSELEVTWHAIERSNLSELEGEILHVVLAHLRPRLTRSTTPLRALSLALGIGGALCALWPWMPLARNDYGRS